MMKPFSPSWLHTLRKLAFWAGLIALIMAFLLSNLAASPLSSSFQETATPQPIQLTSPIPSALPAEYYETEEQSTAVMIGAVVLVLIISISSMSVMFRRKPRAKK